MRTEGYRLHGRLCENAFCPEPLRPWVPVPDNLTLSDHLHPKNTDKKKVE